MSQSISSQQVRSKYLEFYKSRNHVVIPSASLVPENDPTTLFTGSGMQPLIAYFLGEPHPLGTRITDSQKCFRSQDVEEVGDNRHTTYFEMLGNWSFGDYFKKEQIPWVFSFFTDELGLAPENLYVTVYEGDSSLNIPRDQEAVSVWQEVFTKQGMEAQVIEHPENGMQGGRIFYYNTSNWWSRSGKPADMPAGEPGGPDSEVFFDFDPSGSTHAQSVFADQPCHPNCDCGRFLEIGNSVFMQYQKQVDGSFIALPKKNVDFGGGLERIVAAVNGSSDVFTTDLFWPIIEKVSELSGKLYQENQRAFRIIADHLRAAVMLAADGVYPSNKGQGYFSRRLLRRAVRYGSELGLAPGFFSQLVPLVVQMYQDQYTEVKTQEVRITQELSKEELKFAKALDKGLREFHKMAHIDGQAAFTLYERYGFPFELTQELAAEKGVVLKQEDFDDARKEHADKSRSVGVFKGGLADTGEVTTQYHTTTHLLHAALRKILGTHVQQRGSNITAKRLRFDFSHPDSLTDEQKGEIVQQINRWIAEKLPVTHAEMEKDAAFASGALGFFGQKYPDVVTVYTIGEEESWISKELCGGPHVSNTSELKPVEIFKEKAVGEGLRRVYLRTT